MAIAARPLTFAKVWTMFQETDKKFQAMSQEADKRQKETVEQMKESKTEHDRMIVEMRAEMKELSKNIGGLGNSQKETGEQMKELSKNIGGLGNSLGDMAEGLMASDLYETFAALGLDFDQSFQNYEVKDKKTKRTVAEVDKLLVNGTIGMVVETKTTMTRGDVDEHETRMEILRNKPNSLFARRKLYGAMAGVKMSKKARQYAIDKGFFVIELAGNTIKINMPQGFKPKTW
jgi:hypothetical protein